MFIFMISIVIYVLSNLHNVLVTWVMYVLLIVCLHFLVIGVIQMKFFVVLYHLFKKNNNLKFEIFSCDVKYLIALEYLVSQQYENLNFMEVEYYLEVCFSHQLLVLSANLFWKFGILNTQSCHIYWVALMPKEDWRLKIVLNQDDNAKEILVSIVYKLPVNLAFIVCWDSHNFEYNWYLLFLKFFSGFRGRFFQGKGIPLA